MLPSFRHISLFTRRLLLSSALAFSVVSSLKAMDPGEVEGGSYQWHIAQPVDDLQVIYEEQGYALVSRDSYFECGQPYLFGGSQDRIRPQNLLTFLGNSFDTEGNSLFDVVLNACVSDESERRLIGSALQHLLGRWRVFAPDNFNGFQLYDQALQIAQEGLARTAFFEVGQEVQGDARHVVMYLEDLRNKENWGFIQNFFEQDPTRTLVVDVNEEELTMSKDDLPPFLKHLSMTNINNNLKRVGPFFLRFCISLKSLDASGWVSLNKVGDNFCKGNTSMTSMNISGWGRPTLGVSFGHGCTSLRAVNIRVPALYRISSFFLYNTPFLENYGCGGTIIGTEIVLKLNKHLRQQDEKSQWFALMQALCYRDENDRL